MTDNLDQRYNCEECGGTFDDGEEVKAEGVALVRHEGRDEQIEMQEYIYYHKDCWQYR